VGLYCKVGEPVSKKYLIKTIPIAKAQKFGNDTLKQLEL